jgi:hypothetical protein
LVCHNQKSQGVKALWMLWIFLLKLDQNKKARMVCGGSPRQGAITLAHTYANSLDPASERLFWVLAAHLGLTVIGSYIANSLQRLLHRKLHFICILTMPIVSAPLTP